MRGGKRVLGAWGAPFAQQGGRHRKLGCVIFATLQNCFSMDTVRHEFSVRMLQLSCKTGVVAMKSAIVKRSVVIAGRKTSVSLEDAFWEGLKKIAGKRDTSLSDLLAAIDSGRQHDNLSSAIRLFVLDFYCTQSSETDERRDGPHEMATQGAFNRGGIGPGLMQNVGENHAQAFECDSSTVGIVSHVDGRECR
jgi:predicted DNA-binding ribbon-helix-helix protein